MLEAAGFNVIELSAYCRDRSMFFAQVERWRQMGQIANPDAVLSMAEHRDLEKRYKQDQMEF